MKQSAQSSSCDTLLRIFHHDELLWELPLRKETLTIGRLSENDVVLAGPAISRRQARLSRTPEGWQITDLTSTNGTTLAGLPIPPNQPQSWCEGQALTIDEYTLILKTAASATTGTALPLPAAPLPPAAAVGDDRGSNRFNTQVLLRQNASIRGVGNLIMAGLLILAWILALTAVPAFLPVQIASWLTFIALLITPGYLLADLLGGRLELDILEKLGLAAPLGVTILAVPGMTALLLHRTLFFLAVGWLFISGLILFGWVLLTLLLFTSPESNTRDTASALSTPRALWFNLAARLKPAFPPIRPSRWVIDELLMLLLLLGLLLLGLPALTQAKLDGDALAVSTFSAEALAGLPLNLQEPLFGTEHGPGVRMIFNQYMPLSYLWSFFSDVDPLTITAVASRSMLAFFAMMAAYTLGKAAGGGSRRFGLFTALLQMLFYLAAPFVRADNVSIFFFERLNADKFMVVVLLLPPVFALALRFVHQGRRDSWLIALLASLAASTIHPFSSAMLALALTAFGAFHLLFNLRQKVAWRRVAALAVLVCTVMVLPLIQLYLSRGDAPLAPAYPDTFEGWQIEHRLVPVLPFLDVRGLDVYGRLPPLTQYEPGDADTPANPLLVTRFAVNMDRQRLIVFDIDHYMLNPRLVFEPIYLIALLLLPFLVRNVREDITAQFVLSITTAVLFVMFTPWVTPLIGKFVMPWILWRFVWLLPYTLIISLSLYRLLTVPSFSRWVANQAQRLKLLGNNEPDSRLLPRYAAVLAGGYSLLAATLVLALLLLPLISRNLTGLRHRPTAPYFYPHPPEIIGTLSQLTRQDGEAMVLADQELSVTVAAYVANAHIVAHRVPTTSEIFPADEQDVALQRLIDQARFYESNALTSQSLQTLVRYEVQYVVLPSSSALEQQVRLMPDAFTHLVDDSSYSLYRVARLPDLNDPLIQANDALQRRDWATASALYTAVSQTNPNNLAALTGLAYTSKMAGKFETAVAYLEQAIALGDWPSLHYQLGKLFAEGGDVDNSLPELLKAQQHLPAHARVHAAVGSTCALAGLTECAESAFQQAVDNRSLPDDAARLIAVADLWRQQGEEDRAIDLYRQAAAVQPTQLNQLLLATVYQEAERYDEAAAVLSRLRRQYPFSPDVSLFTANMLAARGTIEEAVGMYQHTRFLERLQLYDSSSTTAILAQVLMDDGRWDEALSVVNQLLFRSPASATGYRLYGDLQMRGGNIEAARQSYQQAIQFGPSQIDVIIANMTLLEQTSTSPEKILAFLEEARIEEADEPAYFLALGDQYQRSQQPDEAVSAYLQALALLETQLGTGRQRPLATQQTRAFAYIRLAQLSEALGDGDAAMNYFRAAVTAAPHTGWPHLLVGDAYLRRNNQEHAMAHYARALEVDPEQIDALVRQANLLRRQGQIDSANELYSQAWSLVDDEMNRSFQPGVLSVDTLLASPYLPTFSNESVESRALLAASLNVNPTELILQGDENLSLVHDYVRLQIATNQPEQSIEQYRSWIEAGEVARWSPAILAQYYRGLGDLYLARAENDAANSAYQTAVSKAPWWPEARLAFAQCLVEQGRVTEAIEHLQIARSLSPGSVETAVALANALSQQGDDAAAAAIFQETAAAYPGHPLATLAAARYWQGRSSYALAEQYFSQTLIHNGGSVEAYIGLADTLIAQGEVEAARHLLQDALLIDSQSVDIYVSMGNLMQRTTSNAQALTWYQQGAQVALASQSVNIPLIDALLTYGDSDNALILILAGLDFRPNDPDLQERLAQAKLLLGEVEEQIDQADYRIQLIRGAYFEAQGQPQSAISAFESTVTLGAEDVTPYLALHRLYLAQGDLENAKRVLDQGLAQFPFDVDLTEALANFKARENEPAAALALLETGYEAGSDPLRYTLALARRHAARGEFEQSELWLDQAQTLAPEAAAIMTVFGELAMQQGDEASAIQFLESAVSEPPGSPGTYLLLAQAYELDGRLDEALQAYDRALAMAPAFEVAVAGKAAVYIGDGQDTAAAAVYENGLILMPNSALLLTEYATLLVEQNEDEAALALLAQAELFATDARSIVALSQLWHEMKNVERAEQLLHAAMEREPGSLDLLTALGDIYLERADYSAAEQQYARLVELAPGNPVGYLRLGNLANAQGDRVMAQEYAKLAQLVDPSAGSR